MFLMSVAWGLVTDNSFFYFGHTRTPKWALPRQRPCSAFLRYAGCRFMTLLTLHQMKCQKWHEACGGLLCMGVIGEVRYPRCDLTTAAAHVTCHSPRECQTQRTRVDTATVKYLLGQHRLGRSRWFLLLLLRAQATHHHNRDASI